MKHHIQWECYLTNQRFNYDMILGCNLLTEFGIDFSFKKKNPMQQRSQWKKETVARFHIKQDS